LNKREMRILRRLGDDRKVSNSAICLLNAGWVIFNRSAARLKLSSSARVIAAS
jgi:hypothetical protein